MIETASEKAMDLADRLNQHKCAIEYIADKTQDYGLSSALCSITESMEQTEILIQSIITLNPGGLQKKEL